MAYIEQQLPEHIAALTLLEAMLEKLPIDERLSESWRAEILLSQLGFQANEWSQTTNTLSGGQHTRLLLGRALIINPDLLLLDEPSNHLDLPTLFWLNQFLKSWNGSFVLVSHDQALLDEVTNCTWILRDQSLHFYHLPCSKAREVLVQQDLSDEHRHQSEQKEIDRVTASAKRLAIWGKVYDNESFARKAKKMEKQIERLESEQTALTEGYHWQLKLAGEAIPANRVLEINEVNITALNQADHLFTTPFLQAKSGDRIAIIGANGCGKSTFLKKLWQSFQDSEQAEKAEAIQFHPAINVGYYDQQLQQLNNEDSLIDALRPFASLTDQERKMALINAGFNYTRHQQTVASLSGGERSRLLFVGLSLAKYPLLMLDEPTNHLDLEGKEALCEEIKNFSGALLIVSHDRWLIENSCQRFWFIQDQQLMEYHDIAEVYAQIEATHQDSSSATDTDKSSEPTSLRNSHHSKNEDNCNKVIHEEDALLEKLLELEAKLEADQNRKPTHQKPQLQEEWLEKIAELQERLGL